MKIGSILIHCHDFDRTVVFWQAALHYVPREPAKDGWVVLRDPEDKGPNLSFQGRDRRPRGRSWLHLDLYTADQQAEVERLVALGARRYPWRYRAGDDFIVLEAAKLVASLDQVSKGRFLFGISCGWNAEEMEDHGTVYETRTKKMREQIEAMKEIWTKDTAEYHGQIVDFRPMQTWPKPMQQPYPPLIVGGAFRLAARRAIRYGDGILPAAPSAGSGSPEDFMPRLRQMSEEAGRDPASLSVTLGCAPEDLAVLRRNRDLGVTRMTVRLPPAKQEEILPILDRWAKLIPQVKG